MRIASPSIGDFSLVGPSASMRCASPYATVAASHGRARLDEQATRLEASAEALVRAVTHTRPRIPPRSTCVAASAPRPSTSPRSRGHVELRASARGGERSGRCAPTLQDVGLPG